MLIVHDVCLDLSFCSIGVPELEALAIELSKKVDQSLTKVTLMLTRVSQNNSTALSIKKLIEGRTYLVGLVVGSVLWDQPSESEWFLKRIIEGLEGLCLCRPPS